MRQLVLRGIFAAQKMKDVRFVPPYGINGRMIHPMTGKHLIAASEVEKD